MAEFRIVGLVLLIAGALALAYGGFTYTKETTKAEVGPMELTVKDQETVNIPLWAGVAALVGGGGILLMGSRKS